jgi:hypothetical protein
MFVVGQIVKIISWSKDMCDSLLSTHHISLENQPGLGWYGNEARPAIAYQPDRVKILSFHPEKEEYVCVEILDGKYKGSKGWTFISHFEKI